MRHAIRIVGAIIAVMLLGMAAAISTAGDSPRSPVIGRVAYVPRTPREETAVADGQCDLVYMKLPSCEAVKFRVGHSQLDSDVSGFEWSPDASRLLFVGRARTMTSGSKAQSGKSVPWVLDLRTKKLEPVFQPREARDCLRADWLPDGRRIIAWVLTGKAPDIVWWTGVGPSVKKGGDSRLIVIDLKSRREKTIWQSKYAYFYACSPSRDEFLVWSGDYHLVSADGELQWKIKGSETPEGMVFSPDGQKIAVYVKGQLHAIDRNTKARKLVYESPRGENAHARSLAWSPDGKWVTFREARNEVKSFDPPAVDFDWAVIAVNVDTKKAHEFASEVYRQGECSYTPGVLGWTKDSKSLALSVPEDTGKPRPNNVRDRLVLCPLAGGKGVPVAEITSRTDAFAWLPR